MTHHLVRFFTRRSLAPILPMLLFAPLLFAQQTIVLPPCYEQQWGNGRGTETILATGTEGVVQYHYSDRLFAGITGPMTISELAFRIPIGPGENRSVTEPNVRVRMATAARGYTRSQRDPLLSANLAPDLTGVYTGAWSVSLRGTFVAPIGPYVPLTLSAPFVFDPTMGGGLIVELSTCPGGSTGSQITFATAYDESEGSLGANTYRSADRCGAAMGAPLLPSGAEEAPILRLTYTGGGSAAPCENPYQPNQDLASLAVRGLFFEAQAGATVQPFRIERPTYKPTGYLVSSRGGTRSPWELAYRQDGRTVPRGAGAQQSPGGQLINLPVGYQLLNNGFAGPGFMTQFPQVTLTTPFDLSMQLAVLTPSSADGFALSRANSVRWRDSARSTGFEEQPLTFGLTGGGPIVPLGWEGVAGTLPWVIRSATQPGAGAFPTGPSSGRYFATAGALPAPASTYALETGFYRLPGLTNRRLAFDLSRVGRNTGTLEVLMEDPSGNFSISLGQWSGPDASQSPTASQWTRVSVNFAAFATASPIRFRFVYDDANPPFPALPLGESRVAIDNVVVD